MLTLHLNNVQSGDYYTDSAFKQCAVRCAVVDNSVVFSFTMQRPTLSVFNNYHSYCKISNCDSKCQHLFIATSYIKLIK